MYALKKRRIKAQTMEAKTTPAIKPERAEAKVRPILKPNERCSSETNSLDRPFNLGIFLYFYSLFIRIPF